MSGPADGLPDLTGTEMGRYRLVQRIGRGWTSAVYLAHDGAQREPVAIKVFHDLERVQLRESDIQMVAALQHEHVVQVFEYGTTEVGTPYLAQSVAEGGTLRDLIARTAVDVSRTLEILRAVAGALDAAHEQGVVHQDVKPGNVLFTEGRSPLLADFGVSRISYGLIGTPGYMAPERIVREAVDGRADVYALAALAFEMLTGGRPYADGSPADVLLSTVEAPIPLASRHNPALRPRVDAVFQRALAKDPGHRHASAGNFAEDLAASIAGEETNGASARPAAAEPGPAGAPAVVQATLGRRASADDRFEQSVAKLMEILDLALTASVIVDETSFVVGWNDLAEREFGWTREDILGRSLVTTVIPPRYREAHERGLRHYLETGEGPVFGVKLRLAAVRKDGRELPIELSISEAVRSGGTARILGFLRDVSAEKRAEQARLARGLVDEVLEQEPDLEVAAARILEAIGGSLEWTFGVLWSYDRDAEVLRCLRQWRAPEVTSGNFGAATAAVTFAAGAGLPGRALAGGEPVWAEDFIAEEDSVRALAAARAGLHSAVAAPILSDGGVTGVVELFSADPRAEDTDLAMQLYTIGRRIGRRYRVEPPGPQTPEPPRERR